LLPPKALGAPVPAYERRRVQLRSRRQGDALLGDEEVVGTAGVLIFKPRGQWHTFWNAGDVSARILEIISPGGFEQAFRELDELGGELTPEAVSIIGARYAVDIDFEATVPLIEPHGLSL
jgi:hypothetical protein